MRDLAPLQYPRYFQGLFARKRQCFEPLIEEARGQLHSLDIPTALRPFYDAVIRENPQPSFVLLPLMFLATAEASGGVQAVHRAFLPYLMLSMEAIAVLDDTVDRTPMRSGRPTFALRFGETSATPFVSTLVALLAKELARVEPRLFDITMRLFVELNSLQLWELHHTYPTQDMFAGWLENRFHQSVIGISFGLDTALLLSGREPAPAAVLRSFGRIFQDVDDLVNILEDRDTDGENDDLLMGLVTTPLVLTLERYPDLRGNLSALWAACRATHEAPVSGQGGAPEPTRGVIEALARPIRAAIREVGVHGTVAQVLASYRTCVSAAPLEIRPVVHELARTWVDRLRRCKGVELVTEEQIQRSLDGVALIAA
jgi:geranylgeranyl pyrophosphate synthase